MREWSICQQLSVSCKPSGNVCCVREGDKDSRCDEACWRFLPRGFLGDHYSVSAFPFMGQFCLLLRDMRRHTPASTRTPRDEATLVLLRIISMDPYDSFRCFYSVHIGCARYHKGQEVRLMPTPHLDSRVLFPLEGGGLPYQLHRGFGVSSAGKVTFRYMDPVPRALNA